MLFVEGRKCCEMVVVVWTRAAYDLGRPSDVMLPHA